MKIADYTQGRDNNFNLIRIIAAYAVLITHSFALALGSGDAEPFRDTLGMTMGSIAVDVFFVTSGFLVTASLLTRKSAIEFVWARFFRIFPGLLAMLLLTVLGLGLFFTSLPVHAYFSDPRLPRYFLKCLTLVTGVAYELPDVFTHNPYKNAVNGSLWTMPLEIAMYAMLASSWVALRLIPGLGSKAFRFAVISGAGLAGSVALLASFDVGGLGGNSHREFLRLFFMFFGGSTLFILKDKIALSRAAFWIGAVALLIASLNAKAFFLVYMVTLAYMLMYVAYVPSGFIRNYNKLGDYSYGVYIYAFPVQQATAALIPGVSVLGMVMVSTVATLVLSILSWHLIEKHALKAKGQYVHRTRRLLSLA